MTTKQAFKAPQVMDVCLPVYELRYGMFVSSVDCGWERTPFKPEGLLITTPQQIATLAGVAEYVNVDPRRGHDIALKEYLRRTFGSENYHLAYEDLDTLDGITAIEPHPPSRNHPMPVSSLEDEAEPVNARAGARSGWLRRLGSLWNRGARLDAPVAQSAPAPDARQRPSYIPPEITLSPYPSPEFAWPALPIAVAACDAVATVIEQVFAGLASRSLSDLRRLNRAADVIVAHIIAHPGAMMWAARMREGSRREYRRSLETAIYMAALGRHLGFPHARLMDLALTGMLLDIGKTRIDASLLDKQDSYTDAERKTVRMHVDMGVSMLEKVGTLDEEVLRGIAEHHEQMDGNGYPRSLRGSRISLYGRMAAITDAYVAMINPRPYAPALAPNEAIRQLLAGADKRWFGPLTEQFSQAIGHYPVGSLVELASGHTAIVVQYSPQCPLEPKILIVTHSGGKPRFPPLQIDMQKHNARQEQSRLQILKGLPEGAHGIRLRDFYFGPR